MRVVEQFVSINGEGPCAGELAVFVRFQGCNLTCSYCDTAWANEGDCPYREYTAEEVAREVAAAGVSNVTLTGGEPLLQGEMAALLAALSRIPHVKRVEIETNGSVDLEPFCGENRPIFTMDYKLPTSGWENSMCHNNFALLRPEDTVKFVCGSREDLERARGIMEQYHLVGRCNLYLSPVFGQMEPSEMVEYMLEHHMNGVRLQIQMHKVIWHPDQRGV